MNLWICSQSLLYDVLKHKTLGMHVSEPYTSHPVIVTRPYERVEHAGALHSGSLKRL